MSIAGVITDSYSYKAFGEKLSESGTTLNPLRYEGQYGYYRDLDTRLYVRAREYEPELGRWVSRWPDAALTYPYQPLESTSVVALLSGPPQRPGARDIAYRVGGLAARGAKSPARITWQAALAPGFPQGGLAAPARKGAGVSCLCSPPYVAGAGPHDPHFACYARVCRLYALWCQWQAEVYNDMCPNPIGLPPFMDYSGCANTNARLGNCQPSNPYYKQCFRSGGGGLHGGALCCIQCLINVCCSIEAPYSDRFNKWVHKELKRCAGGG